MGLFVAMRTQPLIWLAAIALILFFGALAVLTIWVPASARKPDDLVASPVNELVANALHAPLAAKCAECGVIQSVRELETKGEDRGPKAVKSYEVTVRLNAGRMHVFTTVGVPSWRSGDKIMVIDAHGLPDR